MATVPHEEDGGGCQWLTASAEGPAGCSEVPAFPEATPWFFSSTTWPWCEVNHEAALIQAAADSRSWSLFQGTYYHQ